MKSTFVAHVVRLALLTLAAAGWCTPVPVLAADSTTGPQMIDAFEGTFGVHAGQRRNHIKGTCAAGEFVGTTDAAALSSSALFSGKPKALWLIDSGFNLAAFIIAGVILAVWR